MALDMISVGTLLLALLCCYINDVSSQLETYESSHVIGGRRVSGPKTSQSCLKLCRNTATCRAVDFDGNGDTCWFHEDDTACTERRPRLRTTHYKFIACGRHIFGGSLQSHLRDTTSCIGGCIGSCEGIDFDSAESTCWFHTGATECNDYGQLPTAIHWRRGTCLNTPTTSSNTASVVSTHPGQHIFNGNKQTGQFTEASCVSACMAKYPSCKGVDYDALDDTCWFHSASTVCDPLLSRPSCNHIRLTSCASGIMPVSQTTVIQGASPMRSVSVAAMYRGVNSGLPGRLTTYRGCYEGCTGSCSAVDYDVTTRRCYVHNQLATSCLPLRPQPTFIHTKMIPCDRSLVQHPCGVAAIRPNIGARIIGGAEVVAHSWPWQVGLYIKGRNQSPNCGATIVNSEWILSAAHCFSGMNSASFWEARLGDHNTQLAERAEMRHDVIKIIRHPNFEAATFNNDIALVKLSSPIVLSAERSPVCLPEAPLSFGDGMSCVVTGWGVLTPGSNRQPTLLNQAHVPLINQGVCMKYYAGAITDQMICAGDTTMDACQGDSGGPLVCQLNEVWYQVGIVSFGIGCAEQERPGVNTRVERFTNWIQLTINSN